MIGHPWLLALALCVGAPLLAEEVDSQHGHLIELLGPDRGSQMLYVKPYLERQDLVAGLGGNLTDPT